MKKRQITPYAPIGIENTDVFSRVIREDCFRPGAAQRGSVGFEVAQFHLWIGSDIWRQDGPVGAAIRAVARW